MKIPYLKRSKVEGRRSKAGFFFLPPSTFHLPPFLLIIFASALFLSGCGYTTRALLPENLKTIYVDNFTNKIDPSSEPSDKYGYRIYRPGVENDITQAITDQFIADGHLRVVNKEDADLVLTGDIIDYYQQPLRYNKVDSVEEYRIVLTVNMRLEDAVSGKQMWEEKGFIGYDTYRLTGAFEKTEEDARSGAVSDLAAKVVEKVVEAW
jgi:outer membrane lipopolysaccharide assembly protein LptE/RlpB